MPSPTDLPTFDDVVDAARQIAGVAVVTPLIENPALNERLGYRLLVKAECLQRTGSFKFRGAYNRISRLTPDERKRGVVAYSSGNHAQAVAYAAKMMGVPAVIVMPADSPAIKVANTKSYGAEVITYDRYRESREEIGRRIATERGSILVPPFENKYIIAGQGTIGLEIAEQAKAMGATPDAVFVNCSGGGLTAGIALALAQRAPGAAVIACEPAACDDTGRSLRSGKRERNSPDARTICDALMTETPGELTFAINSKLVKNAFVATDDEARAAMALAFRELKIVVEPGGAVSLACALSKQRPAEAKTVVAVCSGGNVDAAMFQSALQAA
jgi:threonine dehydratase